MSGSGALICADQTVEGMTDRFVNVTCDTFCLVGYSKNFYLSTFSGIDFEICQALGCAKLDESGAFINDAADRLKSAALGEIQVYRCDETSFTEYPSALQSNGTHPCNFYNPQVFDSIVDAQEQFCTGLPLAGTVRAQGDSWIRNNLMAFIGIVIATIVLVVVMTICIVCKRRKAQGKSNDIRKAIKFKENVTWCQFLALLLVATSTIMFFVFVNTMQAFLLRNQYQVSSDEFGHTSAILGVADEVWSFLWLGVSGMLSDWYGRRALILYGYVLVTVSLFIFPNARTVFPGVLVARLVFAQGSSALASILTALLSDIVAKESLGLGTGLLAFCTGIGAIFAAFVLIGSLPVRFCITTVYYIVAGIGIVLSIITFFAFKQFGKKLPHQDDDDQQASLGKYEMAVKGLKLCWSSEPYLIVAYVAGFAARAGSIVISLYISLWVVYTVDERGLCLPPTEDTTSTCGESLLNPTKQDCAQGFTSASRISGVAQTSTLIFALLIAISTKWTKGEETNTIKALIVFGISAAISYCCSLVVEDPTDSQIYILAAFWGLSDIAIIIYAQFLVTQIMERHPTLRGVISGAYGCAGALGIILITYFGGLLFDIWVPQAPFFLMGVASLVLVTTCILVLFWNNTNVANKHLSPATVPI